MTHPATPTTGSRRGFTMLEMMIVIGIIVLLAGLTLGVAVALARGSEVRQATDTLSLLDSAIREWENAADRTVQVGDEAHDDVVLGSAFDLGPGGFTWPDFDGLAADEQEDHIIELTHEMLVLLNRNNSARTVLANIDPEFLQHDDEEDHHPMTLLDPWGRPFGMVPAGDVYDGIGPENADDDKTDRYVLELRFGIAVSGRVFFVSAGPDGRFGDLQLDTAIDSVDQALLDETRDNVYSVEISRERP